MWEESCNELWVQSYLANAKGDGMVNYKDLDRSQRAKFDAARALELKNLLVKQLYMKEENLNHIVEWDL